MKICALFPILALLTGCAVKKPVHATIDPQANAAQAIANKVQKMLDDYTADVDAARYEQGEITAVQADIDGFSANPTAAGLTQMMTDMHALRVRDDLVESDYIL